MAAGAPWRNFAPFNRSGTSMNERSYSAADEALINLDQALRTLFGRPKTTHRRNPADARPDVELEDAQRDHTARLMRINHTGEVCAQALYQGQALTAKLPEVRSKL